MYLQAGAAGAPDGNAKQVNALDDLGSPVQQTRKTPLRHVFLQKQLRVQEKRLREAQNAKARIEA